MLALNRINEPFFMINQPPNVSLGCGLFALAAVWAAASALALMVPPYGMEPKSTVVPPDEPYATECATPVKAGDAHLEYSTMFFAGIVCVQENSVPGRDASVVNQPPNANELGTPVGRLGE